VNDEMKTVIKKVIGKTLIQVANAWPGLKPHLKSLGLRTSENLFSPGSSVNVQTPTGHSLRLTNVRDNYLSFQVFWKGTVYYEPLTTLVLQELLQPAATFVDVGANIGFFSLVTSVTKPRIKVIAFEPNPKNFRILNENIVANGFENIHCEFLAVSDVIGPATLYLNGSDMSASLLPDFQVEYNPATNSIQTQTTTLDDYFEKHGAGRPLILKVDVEGHEVALLRGGRRMLREKAPEIILEVLKSYPDEVNEFFNELGYNFYQITDHGLVPSKTLVLVRRGDLFFLNYLISKKTEAELHPLSKKLVAMAKTLDLRQTSKYFAPEIEPSESILVRIARFVTRPAQA
jgi:FkbM family methyltransferase